MSMIKGLYEAAIAKSDLSLDRSEVTQSLLSKLVHGAAEAAKRGESVSFFQGDDSGPGGYAKYFLEAAKEANVTYPLIMSYIVRRLGAVGLVCQESREAFLVCISDVQ